jgi:hypothetical protein
MTNATLAMTISTIFSCPIYGIRLPRMLLLLVANVHRP